MQQAMKRLGIKQEQINAIEVIIRTPQHDIVIQDPDVQKVNMMGQWTFQITGEETIKSRDTAPEISEEDIETVMDQTSATKEEALKAIKNSNGDLAEAILSLQK